ncbi:hypothetical protein KCU91_g88, partial [Aureobasidium melanogenum]
MSELKMRQMQLYMFVSVTLGALFAIEQRIWKNSVSCIDQSYYVAAFSIIEAWMCLDILVTSTSDCPDLVRPLRAEFDGPKRWRPRLELKSMRGTVHAGSWRYHCPETEYRSTSASLSSLYGQANPLLRVIENLEEQDILAQHLLDAASGSRTSGPPVGWPSSPGTLPIVSVCWFNIPGTCLFCGTGSSREASSLRE